MLATSRNLYHDFPVLHETGFYHEDGEGSSKGKSEMGTDVDFDFAFCQSSGMLKSEF